MQGIAGREIPSMAFRFQRFQLWLGLKGHKLYQAENNLKLYIVLIHNALWNANANEKMLDLHENVSTQCIYVWKCISKRKENRIWMLEKIQTEKNVGNESKPNKNLNRKDHIEDRVRR